MPAIDQGLLTIPAWRDLWHCLGAQRSADASHERLLTCYREPHRHYHTLQHLNECLANFQELAGHAPQPDEVRIALWYHDAIYDVRAADNEARSADWAKRDLLLAGIPAAVADRVHALILATRHDAAPDNASAEALVDVDLWILGAPAARFDEYERQVRQEYAFVAEDAFRARRAQLLRGFLGRGPIFNTALFRERYEAAAQHNLRRSLERLQG